MEDIMTVISKTSLRALLGAAALASLVSALAAPASAALVENGVEINGVEINGTMNGVSLKGTSVITRRDGAFDFGSVTLVGVTPPTAVAH
jgi:hypothetical protein